MKQVSVFEGKNRFSELVASAASGEPQVITKNGTATAVVISIGEYKRLTARTENLSSFLLNSPLRGTEADLDLTRSKDIGRETIDFTEE